MISRALLIKFLNPIYFLPRVGPTQVFGFFHDKVTPMAAFVEFFEREIKERRNKIFKTKKRLKTVIRNEIQLDTEEEADGTAIQNSNDNMEDIIKRNIIESRFSRYLVGKGNF
jgi:hypothetical protein